MIIFLIVILPLAILGIYLQATSDPTVAKIKAMEVGNKPSTVESSSEAGSSALPNTAALTGLVIVAGHSGRNLSDKDWNSNDDSNSRSVSSHHNDTIFGSDSAFDNDNFGSTSSDNFLESTVINPATGLLMTGGIGGIDAAGNPYGTGNDDIMSSLHASSSDLHSNHFNDTSFLSDDPFSMTDDSFNSFDDSLNSFDDSVGSFDDSFGESSFDDW